MEHRREPLGRRDPSEINFDPERTYIGRWQGGKWGNPFPLTGLVTRDDSLRMYRSHLKNNPELVEKMKQELTGQILVCHCQLNQLCHGDVIIEVLDETWER